MPVSDKQVAMRAASVPVLGARYWTAISLASISGCNMGDFVAGRLHLGHWHGLLPLAIIFALLIFGERRAIRASEAWYWAIIIVIRTAATNLADLAADQFNIEYAWTIAVLEVLQVLAVLKLAPRFIPTGAAGPSRFIVDGWYWTSMLIAGTLGTAIGDCVAEQFKLGQGYGTLVLGTILAVILIIGSRTRWSTASYWFAIVAVRAAGTTAGDFLAFRTGLGLPVCTACTCAVFIAMLLIWRPRQIVAANETLARA